MPNREELSRSAETLLLATLTTAAAQTVSLDTLDYDAAHFNIATGATAPAPTSIVVNESDDNSTWTAVDADSVVGRVETIAGWGVSRTHRIAYVGSKRYVQLVVTPSASTILTITAHRGCPAQGPVANPL